MVGTILEYKTKIRMMIIFDFGNTLIYERDISIYNGISKLLEFANVDADIQSTSELYESTFHDLRSRGKDSHLEINFRQMFSLVLDTSSITISKPFQDVENIFLSSISTCEPTPGIQELLLTLHKMKIRTLVLSNTIFSGAAMGKWIDGLFPSNNFEHIITSGDYGVRKPDPLLFKLALSKAKLRPDEVWMCGDSLDADIRGAIQAGIIPIYYRSNPSAREKKDVDCLEIANWDALAELLYGVSSKNYRCNH